MVHLALTIEIGEQLIHADVNIMHAVLSTPSSSPIHAALFVNAEDQRKAWHWSYKLLRST